MTRKKSKLVRGVGINDADTNTQCPIYRLWYGMLTRCYCKISLVKYPNYVGCTVAPEWLRFSNFKSWVETQDRVGKHLDKDLLVFGNKIYGPDTCVFISQTLNGFLSGSTARRGPWPLGVSQAKDTGKFVASCSNPATWTTEYLGCYKTPEEAHDVWLAKKHAHACAHAATQSDPRIIEALKNRFTKNNYTL